MRGCAPRRCDRLCAGATDAGTGTAGLGRDGGGAQKAVTLRPVSYTHLISDIIHIPGLVNVDFEDVKTVMCEPGKAMMGTAVAGGPDRANKAADLAVACPLLEGIDLSGARGVLVLIAASKATFKLAESRNAMNTIRRYAADEAHVIFGTAYDETLGDQLRVTVIATGLSSLRKQQATPPLTVVQQPQQQGLRTGTDNLPILNSCLLYTSRCV